MVLEVDLLVSTTTDPLSEVHRMDVDQELLSEFVTESLQGLQAIEQDLLTLESDGSSDRELVNRIFRAVHSIKGTGSYMGLDNLVRLSHLAETLLDQVRSGNRIVTADVTDAVLGAVDGLISMLSCDDLGRETLNPEAYTKLEKILGNATPIPVTNDAHVASKSSPAPPAPLAATTKLEKKPDNKPAITHYRQYISAEDLELVPDFINEGLQNLRDIEQDLLSLESDSSPDADRINRIFRAVHTIKGNGSQLRLENLISVSHLAETLLDRIRAGKQEITSNVTDAVLAAVDSLTCMLKSDCLGASIDSSSVQVKLRLALGDSSPSSSSSSHQSSPQQSVLASCNGKIPVYEIKVDLERLHNAIDIKEGVVAGLSSVGKVLWSSMASSEIDRTPSGSCTFYFETVLDEDILSDHLQVDKASIQRVDLKKLAADAKLNPTAAASVEVAPRSIQKSNVDSQPTNTTASPASPIATPAAAKPVGENRSSEQKAAPSKQSQAEQTMRVPVHILHELLECTGTMVMARNQLMNEFNFQGNTAFRTLSQAISGVHETVIATRMQTTGALFERYRRVVRDLARQLGKEVALHIEGGDLELDRSILESFADPLTHLIRNCMDHALETPQEREANGKNRQGNVYLRSYIQSGEIILEVEDDGRGINADKVCEKAVSKGVITAETAARLSEKEKVLLIFQPGFSTKDQATEVSGRGVGMDVVKNNIEGVGGMIDVETRVGQGSKFAAILPLAKALVSSSLTKALIVELQNEQFAIPETAISEIIRFDSRTFENITRVDGQDVFQLRDKLIAIISLEKALGLNRDNESLSKNSMLACDSKSQSRCLVIFQYRKHFFGAVVDSVIGIHEIIVRSTPRLLQECIVYSGHTVLGNGRVSLILDINGLVQVLNLKFMETTTAHEVVTARSVATSATASNGKRQFSQKMLVFTCSANEYFAIPLELVAIIERIQKKDLRTVGPKEFCQLKQETISVMRLDSFLPIAKFDESRSDYCLIRAAALSYPIGILTGPDISVIDVDDTFETRMNDSKGILGTFLHHDRLVMLLDLYSIFEQHAPDKLQFQKIEYSKARILIAEDSLFFRRLIEQYIRCDTWEIEIVHDGLEAWEKLQNEPTRYQLIISDINMPRMDGFELAMRVREDRRFDDLPMVALTTLSENHYREKGLSLGFDRYVIKIDKYQVRQTVAECLKIKRNKQRIA